MKRPNFLNPSAARELAWAERQKDWTLLAHEVAKGLRWKRDHSGMQAGTPMGAGWSVEVLDYLAARCREHGVEVAA